MRANRLRNILFLPLLAAIVLCVPACNSKSDEEPDIVVTPSIVAVKNFYLLSNDSVMKNLDSVFFSIDLNHGVIFNADSLPKGTKVSRLIPSITFANTMTSAELSFRKDNRVDTVVDYLSNPQDSIDFTSPVTLKVTAENGTSTFSYTIKVNVHTVDPDTLGWALISTSTLPSRFSDPVKQKTVWHNSSAYCLVEENDGSFTISSCADLNEGLWDKQEFSPGFYPDVESFSSSDDSFYLLADNGDLYSSSDCLSWEDTGIEWYSVIGGYGSYVLGLQFVDDSFYFTQYPAADGEAVKSVPGNFPVSKSSQLGIIETDWAENPIAILAGGVMANGDFSSDIWGFDGNNWAILNSSALPALESPMLARYVVYKDTPAAFAKREFDAWLLFGGVFDDGSFNSVVYTSIDNGVTWNVAADSMQLPEDFPRLKNSDVIVAKYPLSADLNDAWSVTRSALNNDYTINGTEITWDCPYLFVFGGYLPDYQSGVNTTVWRGVLNRLQFTPQI